MDGFVQFGFGGGKEACLIRTSLQAIFLALLLAVSASSALAADKHYFISLSEQDHDGEIVGEKCSQDRLCQIKLRLVSGLVVTAKSQIVDGQVTIIFELFGNRLYASRTRREADNKFFQISTTGSKEEKSAVYLFMRRPVNDEEMVFNRPNLIAILNIKVRA